MRKKNKPEDSSLILQGPLIPGRLSQGSGSIDSEADDRLLRVDEAARHLGLSIGGVYHLVSQSRIPVVRIARTALCV